MNEKTENPAKHVYEVAVVKKFCVPKIAAVNLSKTYFLKNANQNM